MKSPSSLILLRIAQGFFIYCLEVSLILVIHPITFKVLPASVLPSAGKKLSMFLSAQAEMGCGEQESIFHDCILTEVPSLCVIDFFCFYLLISTFYLNIHFFLNSLVLIICFMSNFLNLTINTIYFQYFMFNKYIISKQRLFKIFFLCP